MMHPLLAMGAVMVAFAAMFVGLRALQSRFPHHPEIIRKLLHVGMGLTVLTFPWLFHENWPVFVLAGVSAGLLLLVRAIHSLGRWGGQVVHGVERQSFGELCFPLAVAVLFALRGPHVVLYIVPLLILTVGDAVAALIGVYYGKVRYVAADGHKTLEGSIAFFTATFFSVHVPLLLMTDVGRAQSLLIALILGLVVMIVEAIAWKGLDNLFIPLGAYGLLIRYMPMPIEPLIARLIATVLLVAFTQLCHWRTTLTTSALMGAALFGYGAWALGGWPWLIPPAIFFILMLLLWPRSQEGGNVHDVRAIVRALAPAMIWVLGYALTDRAELLYAFTVLFATHVSLSGVSRMNPTCGLRAGLPGVLFNSARGWLAVVPMTWAILRVLPSTSLDPAAVALVNHPLGCGIAGSLGAVALASIAFYILLPRMFDAQSGVYRHIHLCGGGMALVASAAALGAYYLSCAM